MRTTKPRRIASLAPVLTVALALSAVAPRPAVGQDVLEMQTARQVGEADTLRLRVEYGAGRISLHPADPGLLYQATLRYDASAFHPLRSYDLSGGVARVRLGLESREGGPEVHFDWEDLDLGSLNLGDMDLEDVESGRIEVGVSRSVPTELEVMMGATEGTLELGGIPLTRLRLATGASETTLSFGSPNPVPMEELRIRAGAASLEVRGLGNAGARDIRVENAVGEVVLDFTGSWSRDARARIKTGVGAVRLRIPTSIGVRLERSSLLSSFSGLGLVKADDGSYRTENWSEAEYQLELEVDAAFGSIEVDRVP